MQGTTIQNILNWFFFSLYNWMLNFFNLIVIDMRSHRVKGKVIPITGLCGLEGG